MKILALLTDSELSHALLTYLKEEGHAVTALFVDHDGADEPHDLCRRLGVELIRVELFDYVRELKADPSGEPDWVTENITGMVLGLGYAHSWGLDALAVPFSRDQAQKDARPPALAQLEASTSLIGASVLLHKPFVTWSRQEILDRWPKPGTERIPQVCFNMLKCDSREDAKRRTTTIFEEVTCKSCLSMLDPPDNRVDEPRAQRDSSGEETQQILPLRERSTPYQGPLRPFIYSAEGIYQYVNDKESFDKAVNQQGSLQTVLDARMTSTSPTTPSTAPTFTMDGFGISLIEWLGTALNSLVETTHMTTPGAGHNPGHHGCC